MQVTKRNIPMELKYVSKDLYIYESKNSKKEILTFFADGFPGLVFFHSHSQVKVIVGELSKVMEPVFLYGQTLEPIQIEIEGPYFFVMVQLFPSFVEETLEIPISELTNSCWTIKKEEWQSESGFESSIQKHSSELAAEAILQFVKSKAKNFSPDLTLHNCIETILESNGSCEIQNIANELGISERTLQRKFQKSVGLTPKQFATIIRFHTSLHGLNEDKNIKLTDIAYENGYSDQSHFIRQFKSFTKEKPFQFREKKGNMSGSSNF
ncbi:AraC family transcriptional regulator [Leptospira biflexa]|nr:AraC family transcriptional regulator [Leptospira biflexa]TGM34479.1 AraC family transcriptional regulator [Leptospira biflexa]TGM43955.1 AraC family transcriptional regulator [Leptospira biflexa]TGM44911.1 AraC family transcriptional regulator [Leptospira biflexa]